MLQFTKEGKFVRVVEEVEKGIIEIAQGEGNNIYCYNIGDIKCYNSDGKLLYKFMPNMNPSGFCFFNNKLWYFVTKLSDEITYYLLCSSDAEGNNFKTEMEFKEPSIDGTSTWKYGQFNISESALHFSMGFENSNTMYQIDNEDVMPYLCFKVKDVSALRLNKFLSPPFKKVGNYLFYGYAIDRVKGVAVYNATTNKCVTINYKYEGNKLVGGIKDDVFNTGFIVPIFNTNNNSFYFYEKITDTSKSPTPVYLINLK